MNLKFALLVRLGYHNVSDLLFSKLLFHVLCPFGFCFVLTGLPVCSVTHL